MKITIKELRKIIKQELNEKMDLGKIAFGANRKNHTPFEHDTQDEKHLLKSISDYLNKTTQLSQEQTQAIKDFLSTGQYNDIFIKPNVETVYRGIFLPKPAASNLIGIPLEDLENPRGTYKKHLNITSKDGPISSWSQSFSTALNFGRNALHKYGSPDNIIIIFKASTSENNGSFFDLHNLYTNVEDPYDAIKNVYTEKEVFGLGPISSFETKWYHNF